MGYDGPAVALQKKIIIIIKRLQRRVKNERRKELDFNMRFLKLGTIDILDQIILCCLGMSFALRMLSSLPTHWMSISSLPNCDHQKCLQTFLNVPGRQKSPPIVNHGHRLSVLFRLPGPQEGNLCLGCPYILQFPNNPSLTLCPNIIIHVFFHSQKDSSLDDKLCGRPT